MVLVLDYNVGNVNSVIRAAKLYTSDVIFSNRKEDIVNAKKIIMPGQGSFDFAMNNLFKLDIYDTIRENNYNEILYASYAGVTTAESSNIYGYDFLSNGVKFRGTNDGFNGSRTYMYMAFAESPFVNSNKVPNNAR